MRLTWPSTAPELQREGESGGDGVLVAAQAGDEGPQRGVGTGDHFGHPLLEVASAALGHQPGERLDVRGDGGQLRAAVEDDLQQGLIV